MTVKELFDYHESFYPKDTTKRRKELVKLLKIDESDYTERSGKGIKCNTGGKEVLCGNEKLMDMENITFEKCDKSGFWL